MTDRYCENLVGISGAFPLAYYDLDFKSELSKWVRLMMTIFPGLLLTSPDLVQDFQVRTLEKNITPKTPLRIGFISSFFTSQSSIWNSFGGIIRHLQKYPRFQVDMIYYNAKQSPETDSLSMNPKTNIYLDKFAPSPFDSNLHKARETISSRMYDVLVYLDLYMSSDMHHLALSKLAPLQMYTHGHPVTSGIPRNIMDYFISWKSAELSKNAQRFYTEELVTIAEDVVWEYFEPRTKDGTSLISGLSFSHINSRKKLGDLIFSDDDDIDETIRKKFSDKNSKIYFCAQASFKLHPKFDMILQNILANDPNAVIVLVKMVGVLSNLHVRIKKRLSQRLDMKRIIFVPRMRHDTLMAMYSLSDVVLDSYVRQR